MSDETNSQQSKQTSEKKGYRLPNNTTMQHASKLAIVNDKPIMMDYWTS